MTKHVFTLGTLLALTACATDKPLSFRCPVFDQYRTALSSTPGQSDQTGVIGAAETVDPLVAKFAESLSLSAYAAPGEAPALNYLLLSGGGQWGAFGAGFMKAWSAKGTGDAKRPRFDVVTGVSTGALQATFAFLGSETDGKLLEAYTISSERQLVKRHGTLFFLNHASMADTAPLEAYVRAKVSPLLDQVAAPENAGRALLVGAVDGLDGRMYAIDLKRMATELRGQQREDCYVGALLASSAVPVVFRQVRINDQPYLDGGVRQSVFAADVQSAAGIYSAGTGRKGTMWILMNGDETPKAVAKLPPKLLPTLNRLRSIVFNQVELASIFGAARTFPEMDTKVATAIGNNCHAPQDEEDEVFSPTVMSCLRRYGQERWATGVPWSDYKTPALAAAARR